MGQTFSSPVACDPSLGYVGVALRSPNKIRLVHAPGDVVSMTERVIGEINRKSGEDAEAFTKDKHGTIGMKLGSYCFTLSSGKVSATSGKLFTILMFEEMYKLGYDSVVSSDLSRNYDQATWFFVKRQAERPPLRVACLAPGKSDTLVMLRADTRFIDTVRNAIIEAWPLGIQNEKTMESCGETLTEIKLNGNPWIDYAGAENINCRQMLLKILGQLGSINYKLLAGTNIKGGTDSLFFIQDPGYSITPASLCMISLNKYDRLRLVNCTDMAGQVRDTITKHYGVIQREEDKYGSWEFKLTGNPWCCSGDLAIRSRQLISRISETMLVHGWALTSAIDITRSLNDKSVLLYTRAQNFTTTFACIALSDVHRVRLLDFSPSHTEALREVLEQAYLPGVKSQGQRDNTCYEIDLNGPPWTQNSSYNLHARCFDQILVSSN
eukprot:GFUD01026546.1.p1 GENE.GFUD01026546.1~~GFUD01026546.1.p1  ORF type:complete len:438 (+),score=109.53 GFUD01026546.1:178-1491(+)